MRPSLERRAKAIRSRSVRRGWEYRQRDTSHGVWFRVGRALADAVELWIISDDDADRLIEEGFVPDPAGRELEPPKNLLRVPRARLAQIKERRAIPVNLGPAFLGARDLVMIPFEEDGA
jgi:hypothetical protein